MAIERVFDETLLHAISRAPFLFSDNSSTLKKSRGKHEEAMIKETNKNDKTTKGTTSVFLFQFACG